MTEEEKSEKELDRRTMDILHSKICYMREELTYYFESLEKILILGNDKAKYIASRALGRYKNERA